MNTRYHLNRLLLACGAAAALALLWFLAATFRIPFHRGFEDSLLRQPNAIVAVLVVFVGFLVATVICTLIAGSVRADAGLFCAAIGMMSLSLRAGPMRYVLFDSTGSVFYVLAFELVVLFAALMLGWFVVERLAAMGWTRRQDPDFTGANDDGVSLDQKFLTTALAACATATVLGLLARSDAKAQSLAAVFVASAIGSGVAVMIAPVGRSVWYWPAPLVVGLLGYVWSSFSPENLAIGQPSGYFAALARPLPIDYASAGVAGAMLGYWLTRAWTRPEPEADHPVATPSQSAQ